MKVYVLGQEAPTHSELYAQRTDGAMRPLCAIVPHGPGHWRHTLVGGVVPAPTNGFHFELADDEQIVVVRPLRGRSTPMRPVDEPDHHDLERYL